MKIYMMRAAKDPELYVAKINPTMAIHDLLDKKSKLGFCGDMELHTFTRKGPRGFKRQPGMWTTARALRQIITQGTPCGGYIIDFEKETLLPQEEAVKYSLDAIEVVVVEDGQERAVSAREVFHNKELYK